MLSFKFKQISFRFIVLLMLLTTLFFPMYERATGSFQLHSANRSEVRAPVPGFLKKINYDEGAEIKFGALIARLEVHDLKSLILRKQSEIKEAESVLHTVGINAHIHKITNHRRVGGSLITPDNGKTNKRKTISGKMDEFQVEFEFARDNYNWMTKLYEKKVIGEKEFKIAKKNYRVWQSQVQQVHDELEAKQAHLEVLQEELRYLEQLDDDLNLYSPLDGVVITPKLQNKTGSYYEEGELILEVADPTQLEVEMRISELEIANIKAGQKVVLKVLAFPYKEFHAKIASIAPVIISDNMIPNTQMNSEGNVIVYCKLDEFYPELSIGMGGYARIYIEQRYFVSVIYHRLMRFIRTEFWW